MTFVTPLGDPIVAEEILTLIVPTLSEPAKFGHLLALPLAGTGT